MNQEAEKLEAGFKKQEEDQSQQKEIWNLYGNQYDLKEFAEKHPGGSQILQLTKGHLDITSMFESYHAFANFKQIKEQLDQYKVISNKAQDKLQLYTFKEGDFYSVVRSRVRKYFGDTPSVNNLVKINKFWVFRFIVIVSLYLFNLFQCFLNLEISQLQSCIHAFFAGVFLLALGMCVFHDSSHFAVFQKNFTKNDTITRIIGAFLLWRPDLWMTHHSFRHHAYTGHSELDPDIQNFSPYFRKADRLDKSKYIKIKKSLIPLFSSFLILILPGMYMGQVQAYWNFWPKSQILWNMKYPIKKNIKMFFYEKAILVLIAVLHIYRLNIWVSFFYFVGSNLAYALSIIADHDTFATHQNYDESKKDWGEVQVRNSGNFFNGKYYDIFNFVFGGINYQIEHHLFPSLCSIYLPEIQPIVIQTCKEFNIPYVQHENLITAYMDFIKVLQHMD